MFRSKTSLILGLAIAGTAILSACGGGGDDSIAARVGLSKPTVRVIHAIPGGPNVDVWQNGAKTNLLNEPYKFVSTYRDVTEGNQLFAFNIAGTSTELGHTTIDAHTGHKYTAVAMPGSDTAADVIQIDDPFEVGLFSDKARVRALNASFNAQNVDIYVTVPAVDLNSVTPTFSAVAFKSAVPASGKDSISLNGGTYRLRITTAGSKTVIFDSGTLTLANNADWLITTLPVDGIKATLPNRIKVLVARGDDESQAGLELVTQPLQ
ncbi:hisitidine kinase [Cupriavidus sp. UYMMa02A]|nr:hisitidine kinase [Cupriavidus sp. UYMMa02A]